MDQFGFMEEVLQGRVGEEKRTALAMLGDSAKWQSSKALVPFVKPDTDVAS